MIIYSVALDPVKAVGEAFEVYTLPTTPLLDRQGIVRSVQVGMTLPDPDLLVKGGGIRRNLAKEIDLLLNDARPPLPEPKPTGIP